jgi:hypothetical protein
MLRQLSQRTRVTVNATTIITAYGSNSPHSTVLWDYSISLHSVFKYELPQVKSTYRYIFTHIRHALTCNKTNQRKIFNSSRHTLVVDIAKLWSYRKWLKDRRRNIRSVAKF